MPKNQFVDSPSIKAARSRMESLTAATENDQPQPNPDLQNLSTQPDSDRQEQARPEEYVSKVGILTTSLPFYHNQIMKAKKEDEERAKRAKENRDEGEDLDPHEAEMLSKMSLEVGSRYPTSEQQAESYRRLKPHSRSTVHLQTILKTAPQDAEDAATQAGQTSKAKGKSTKWQFGIRSKNEPLDALKSLYRALVAMGDCQWHNTPPEDNVDVDKPMNIGKGPYPVNVTGALHLVTGDANLSESPEKDRHQARGTRRDNADNSPNTTGKTTGSHTKQTGMYIQDDSDSERDSDVDIDNPPPGYVPKDPWCIHVRWEKTGMTPAGGVTTSSASSSHIDLNTNDGSARRGSIAPASLNSAGGSSASVTGGAEPQTVNFDNTACFVYLDIQIYSLEMETYLVDFKCAGYETIIGSREVVTKKGETITEYIGSGVRIADKDVTSPQPFLDLVNRLVIQLANGS